MKRKNIIIGTVGIVALTALFVFNPFHFGKGIGSYSPKDLSVFEKQIATDAQIWMAARYVDIETGKKITSEKLKALMESEKNRKRAGIVFEELGPDNVGGRTRAIQVDRQNASEVWVGGVSGGLFYSADGANNWARVDAFPGMPYISSMTQTEDLTMFVATGSHVEGWDGDGLYYKLDNSDTWQLVPGTGNFFTITQVTAPQNGNTVFFATNSGLKKWTVGDASITSITTATGACFALEISRDGQVIVANSGSSGKTYVSNDGGNLFTDVSGTGTGKIPNGASRIEYAISPTKNSQGNYTIYASRTAGNLLGMNISLDNGMTWTQFIGASNGGSLDIYRGQGTYNSIMSVDPSNTERLLIGGIDIWEWEQTASSPPSGGFDQLSQWNSAPTSDKYVHADNHEMKWDQNNLLYLGNDGGVGISTDYGKTFYPANRGYNVTQFYGIAMDKHGAVMGGTQDNGTLYNDFSMFGYKNFRDALGGDGFECEISFYNPDVIFASLYYNSIARSFDKGFSFSSFIPDSLWSVNNSPYLGFGEEGSVHPFHTEIAFAEYLDPNSKDSITYFPKQNYSAGASIRVGSMATGDSIDYVTTKNLYFDDTVFFDASLTRTDYIVKNSITGGNVDLGQTGFTIIYNAAPPASPVAVGDSLLLDDGSKVLVSVVTPYQHYFASSPDPLSNDVYDIGQEQQGYNVSWDTVKVADPYQSWFFIYVAINGGEIWGTRDAARFATKTKWVIVANNIGYGSMDIEFSENLQYCFVSCGSKVYRIDGLDDIYSQQSNFETAAQAAGTAKKSISNLSCEGIALNPNDPSDLVIIQGGFGGSILRSSNATAVTPTFSNIGSLGVAAYDGVISSVDEDVIVIGTAFGVYVSENGGADWATASGGFENVPVFEVRQNWRTWDEGCYRPGEIYLGTFGRGIWASSSYLSIPGKENAYAEKIKTDLKVYPNPTTDYSVLSFNLSTNSTVNVRVYNIAGQEVKNIELKNLAKGQHTVDIDASNLRNGSYIVKFQAGKVSETVKFMKL